MTLWKQVASAAELEEYERWSAWVTAQNRNLAKRECTYRTHIEGWCDTTLAQRDGEDGEHLAPGCLERLSCTPDLLEDYLSSDPQSIHEFFCDEAMSAAVKKCSSRQKEVLHCYLIPKIKTADVALILGTSDRNILKLLATAKKNIFREMGETI